MIWVAVHRVNHNSHHEYPRSARHGLDGEPDESYRVIQLLERVHLAWEVNVPKR